jgi:hypothetical protein
MIKKEGRKKIFNRKYPLFSGRGILYFLMFFVSTGCTKKMVTNIEKSAELRGNFENILIHTSTGGTGPCEPSISINPKDPDKMVAASVLNNVYCSDDGGKTWEKSVLTSKHGVYGDPVVRYDHKGNVYYSHLANSKGKAYSSAEFLDRIVVHRSSDNGKTWTDGTFPKADHNKDHDKQWKAIHPVTGEIAITWTEFDVYGSKEKHHTSKILFSISRDNGNTWSDAIEISDKRGDCLDDDGTTEGAHPAFGVNGEIYVVWSVDQKIMMDISLDGGKTWGQDVEIAQQPGGWSFEIPGIKRCNGFPVIKIDHSNKIGHGYMYVQWADQRNGINDTDVFMIVSKDGGKSWSDVKRINDDTPGKHQFFSWMDLDQKTGFLYFVFYDRRFTNDENTDVYLAYTTDMGQSFSNVKVSDTTFKPGRGVFFGDYNDICAENGIVRPVWTRLDGNVLSVYTALIYHK